MKSAALFCLCGLCIVSACSVGINTNDPLGHWQGSLVEGDPSTLIRLHSVLPKALLRARNSTEPAPW